MATFVREDRHHSAGGRHRPTNSFMSADDAELIRRVAEALVDDDEAALRLREALRLGEPTHASIKFRDWLASFPSKRA